MKINGQLAIAVSFFTVIAMFLGAESAQAQGGTLSGRSQFRRLADPSERSASGTLVLSKKGNEQTVVANLKGLTADSLAMYFAPDATPPFQDQNFPNYFMYDIAPIGRLNEKTGTWNTRLIGTGEAPPLIPFISDLDQAAGHGLVLGKLNENPNIINVTNVVGSITNIVIGIPLPTGGKTGTVSSTFWARWPVLAANSSALSYRQKALLLPPAVNPTAPKARATLSYRLNGSSGQSVFDVRASGLPGGQILHVYIGDSPNTNTALLIDAGTLTMSKSGTSGRFLRDTKFGDPLPQQAANAGDLAGRVIQVLDLNGNPPFVYVEGVIP